jgi:hypothetical protein
MLEDFPWPAAPTDLERVESAVRWLRHELDYMKDRDAWRTGSREHGCAGRPVALDARLSAGPDPLS